MSPVRVCDCCPEVVPATNDAAVAASIAAKLRAKGRILSNASPSQETERIPIFHAMSKKMRVGVLTGGGDAPGLNPAIKGLVYRGSELGLEVFGLLDGWRSLLDPLPEVLPLNRETVR